MSARVYFFGCWNQAGHYLHEPGGRSTGLPMEVEYYGGAERIHIDGSLAPRKMGRDHRFAPEWVPPGSLCWTGQGKNREARQRIDYDSTEYPQGQYLLHHIESGFTAIAWWDRCQGDTRGGCSSTVLLEGKHDAASMLVALAGQFPHVLANLQRHGVELVEAKG